ncbi:hypothetical protein RJ640_021042 [Escallonia rubra]|uniref:Uncharacterized protein n=1 Tax=Escallonia rubra TaxID=112253 RepID=A0AA88SN06_9ASTE|nr:hypothetical protein RJ640_021042 [Escallonia rubra]
MAPSFSCYQPVHVARSGGILVMKLEHSNSNSSAMSNTEEPLLNNRHHHPNDQDEDQDQKQVTFVENFGAESKKLWRIAGPVIFTSISQYSLGALTQTFAGLVGELELATVSVENSTIAGLALGVMVREILKHYMMLQHHHQKL